MCVDLIEEVSQDLFAQVTQKFTGELKSLSEDERPAEDVESFYGMKRESNRYSLTDALESCVRDGKKLSGRKIYELTRKGLLAKPVSLKRSPYKKVFFNYLGHDDVFDYLQARSTLLGKAIVERQIQQLNRASVPAVYGDVQRKADVTARESHTIELDEQLERLKGRYECYSVNPEGGLRSVIVELHPSNKLRLNTPFASYEGTALSFIRGNLSLRFKKSGAHSKELNIVLYVGYDGELSYNFEGLGLTTDNSDNPIAVRFVARKVGNANMKASLQKGKLVEVDPSHKKAREAISEVNKVTRNLFHYLMGRANNIMVAGRRLGFGEPRHRDDFAQACFYSALHFAQMGNVGNAEKYLKKSFLSGFNDINQLLDAKDLIYDLSNSATRAECSKRKMSALVICLDKFIDNALGLKEPTATEKALLKGYKLQEKPKAKAG